MEKIDYSAAMAFALERHGQQDHGCLKIGDHLKDVVEHVQKHYDDVLNYSPIDRVVAAAWLHDVVEDTTTSEEEITERFGWDVGSIVYCLTDKEGKNRMERHLHTYHLIRRNPDATLVKLCDRRHNQARSIEHGERWMSMYLKEYIYFKFALWEPNEFVELWEELDQQYEEMNRKMSW
jgi:(p)ppGpp synthase/HD superfamily hydrolase